MIDSVEISRTIKVHWNEKGEYAPHIEHFALDITPLLDDAQRCALADEIKIDRLEAEEAKADAQRERQIESYLDRNFNRAPMHYTGQPL